jgi:hypothetical protein
MNGSRMTQVFVFFTFTFLLYILLLGLFLFWHIVIPYRVLAWFFVAFIYLLLPFRL